MTITASVFCLGIHSFENKGQGLGYSKKHKLEQYLLIQAVGDNLSIWVLNILP